MLKPRSLKGDAVRVGRRIEDGQLAVIGPGIVEHGGKTAGMGGDDNRQFGLAPVSSVGGRGLRIKIDDQGIEGVLHCRAG